MQMTDDKKTILLIDDDEDFLIQTRIQLEHLGYDVTSAQTRAEAQQAFSDQAPDAVICDLMMDEMDTGFVLSYEMKKIRPDIPIIMITAVMSETGMGFDVSGKSERSWIKTDVLLSKPIRLEQLRDELERLLRERA